MTYRELKEKQQKEVNDFPMGVAFGDEQFEKMMNEWGFTTNDTDLQKIVSLGAGCYLRKQDVKAFMEMNSRHQKELKEFRKQKKEFINALVYQLHNHEFGYSRSDDDIELALGALGLSWEDVREETNPFNYDCLCQSIKQCIKESVD